MFTLAETLLNNKNQTSPKNYTLLSDAKHSPATDTKKENTQPFRPLARKKNGGPLLQLDSGKIQNATKEELQNYLVEVIKEGVTLIEIQRALQVDNSFKTKTNLSILEEIIQRIDYHTYCVPTGRQENFRTFAQEYYLEKMIAASNLLIEDYNNDQYSIIEKIAAFDAPRNEFLKLGGELEKVSECYLFQIKALTLNLEGSYKDTATQKIDSIKTALQATATSIMTINDLKTLQALYFLQIGILGNYLAQCSNAHNASLHYFLYNSSQRSTELIQLINEMDNLVRLYIDEAKGKLETIMLNKTPLMPIGIALEVSQRAKQRDPHSRVEDVLCFKP